MSCGDSRQLMIKLVYNSSKISKVSNIYVLPILNQGSESLSFKGSRPAI